MEEKRGGIGIVSGIVIIAAVFAIAYLFYNISTIGNGSAAPQPQYTPTMSAQMTATLPHAATGTPTLVFTPTIDVQATSNANAIAAAQINLSAAETQAAGVIIAANIQATTEANKAISAERVAQIEANAQRERDEAANQGAAIANERIRLEMEAERVKQDERKAIPNIILAVAAFLFSVFLLAWLVLSWRAREVVTNGEEVTENELERPVVQMMQRAEPNYPAVEEMDANDAKILTDAAYRLSILMGGPISNRKQNLIGKAELLRVRTALVNYGMARETTDGLVINKKGQDEILKLVPFSTDKPLETGNSAGVTHHATPQNTRVSGRLYPKLK